MSAPGKEANKLYSIPALGGARKAPLVIRSSSRPLSRMGTVLFVLWSLCHLAILEVSAEGSEATGSDNIVGHAKAFENDLKASLKVQSLANNGQVRDLSLAEVVRNVMGRDRSIILAVASFVYLDFVQNWVASVERFRCGGKVVFLAQDRKSYEFLRARWPKQVVFVQKDKEEPGLNGGEGYTSRYFRSIVSRKPSYIEQILNLNVSVFFNDMDLVWLKNPYRYFTGDYDIWAQEDGTVFEGSEFRFVNDTPAKPILNLGLTHSLCTCFMMIRPTEASKQVIREWRIRVETATKDTRQPVHDQPELNTVVAAHMEDECNPSIRVGVLPVQNFPSGLIFFGEALEEKEFGPGKQNRLFLKAVKAKKAGAVIVHNNWIIGHGEKLRRFKEHNLWFVPEAGKEG